VTGLATDYCVMNTVLDSLRGDLRPASLKSVIVLESAIRGVFPTPTNESKQLMKDTGAILMKDNYIDPTETLAALCDTETSSPISPISPTVPTNSPSSTTCSLSILPSDALFIIDVQNDFLPERVIPSQPNYEIPSSAKTEDGLFISSGSLGVTGGDEIIPIINTWIAAFRDNGAKIFASLDWHPHDSCSFCSTGGVCAELGPDKCGVIGNETGNCSSSALNRCQDTIARTNWNQNQLVRPRIVFKRLSGPDLVHPWISPIRPSL